MKTLSPWLIPLAVVICLLPLCSPCWGKDSKSPNTLQSVVCTVDTPSDELVPKYKDTRQVTFLPRELIGWWTGDSDAIDSLAHNSGRTHGKVAYVPGMVGQAFHFDGDKSYIKVSTTDLDPGTGPGFTLDMWVKADDLSKIQPLAGWSGTDTSGVSLWLEPASDAGKAKLGADLRDTKGGSHRLLSTQPVIVAGQWQHVLLEYDKAPGIARLFCDGTLQAEKGVGSFDTRTNLDFYLGKHFYINGGNTTFKGALDEISVTARALDLAEVQDIFKAGSAGKQLLADKNPAVNPEQRVGAVDQRLGSFVAKHRGQAISLAIYVDGSDFVHIRGNKLWLVHEGWQLPGGNDPIAYPTRVNGTEWIPTWNDKTSDQFVLATPLPQKGEPALFLDILNNGDTPAQSDARPNVRITQEPTAANNYEAVLYIDDLNVPGAHWFAFNLSWNQK